MKRAKFKIIDSVDLAKVVNEIFENREEIQLAYLYGSYANGSQTVYSDIDISILIKGDFKISGLYLAELSSEIERRFYFKINIDLRILNNSTPRFLFQVIKHGKIFYFKHKSIVHEFEMRVLFEYQDIKPILDMYDRISVMEVLGDEY